MRLIALEKTDAGTVAAYRWLHDPFASPRILIEESGSQTALADIRTRIEKDYIGEPLREGQYIIATGQPALLEELQATFAGFPLRVLPGMPIARVLFAAEPLTFTQAIDAAEQHLVRDADNVPAAQAALYTLRQARVRLIGASRRSRNAAHQALGAVNLPIADHSPEQIERDSLPGGPIFTIVHACADPGLSRFEAAWLGRPHTALALFGELPDGQPAPELAVLRERLPALPILNASDGLLLRAFLRSQLAAQLENWLMESFTVQQNQHRISLRLANARRSFSELIL